MATSLDAVLAQYEKNTKPTGNGNSINREDRLKKYFTTILLQGETSGRRRIRILPTPDNSSPFKEVWFHEVQVNKEWLKLYDPGKNDNEPSPLNDLYDELMSTGKAQDKELANQYRSRKFYIVKVIDRDNEADGVKFWRFKHNYKNEGVLDKIIPIWREKGDVTDPKKGRDLIITLTKSKAPNGKEYTTIQSIMHDDPSALHKETKIAEEWIADEMTWDDVYSKKPYEYLEAISRGETPRWDSATGKYVYGDEGSAEFGGTNKSSKDEETELDPQHNELPSEELPF